MTLSGKLRVLVVDDEFAIRDNLEQLLNSSGYDAVAAANGEEALERASEQEFEIALLDMRMPGMSGSDVLQRLLRGYPDIGVIMVTAVAEVKTAVEAMNLGAFDYVTKPFDLDDILARVEKAKERRALALLVKNHQKEIEERLLQREKELRAMTTQTIQAIFREETMARELEAKGGKSKGQPMGPDMKELSEKILRRLSGDRS